MSFLKELENVLGKETDILTDKDIEKKPVYVSKDEQSFEVIFLTESRKVDVDTKDGKRKAFVSYCIIKDIYQQIQYEKRVLSYMSKGIYFEINKFKPLLEKKLRIITHTLDVDGFNRTADVKELELSDFEKDLIQNFKNELKETTQKKK